MEEGREKDKGRKKGKGDVGGDGMGWDVEGEGSKRFTIEWCV